NSRASDIGALRWVSVRLSYPSGPAVHNRSACGTRSLACPSKRTRKAACPTENQHIPVTYRESPTLSIGLRRENLSGACPVGPPRGLSLRESAPHLTRSPVMCPPQGSLPAAALLLLGAAALPRAALADEPRLPRRYAVLAGINQYDNTRLLPKLSYAVN